MAATNTAFIFFSHFKDQLGKGNIDLSAANTFNVALHTSAAQLSQGSDISTYGSVAGQVTGAEGSASRALANVTWTAASAGNASAFYWDSDAVVWTASATMTVKFAVFYQSLGAGTGRPIGFIGLVASPQEVTAGNTVTLTPNTYWFRMS